MSINLETIETIGGVRGTLEFHGLGDVIFHDGCVEHRLTIRRMHVGTPKEYRREELGQGLVKSKWFTLVLRSGETFVYREVKT